jgi:hypothetical protein
LKKPSVPESHQIDCGFDVFSPDAESLMLGPPKSRRLNEPILVSLDDLVPPSDFYRHLERALDLAFVRDLVRETYAETGRPSIDPIVFFKLQLIFSSKDCALSASSCGSWLTA